MFYLTTKENKTLFDMGAEFDRKKKLTGCFFPSYPALIRRHCDHARDSIFQTQIFSQCFASQQSPARIEKRGIFMCVQHFGFFQDRYLIGLVIMSFKWTAIRQNRLPVKSSSHPWVLIMCTTGKQFRRGEGRLWIRHTCYSLQSYKAKYLYWGKWIFMERGFLSVPECF